MREATVVPDATPTSYYGKPILKAPVWKQPDVPMYLYLGGVAGVSAVLAEGAAMSDLPALRRVARLVAAGASSAGAVALVHDLGRPERFLNMLRVFKPTSPLSVGSWVLAGFSSLAGVAAASELTGRLPAIGRLAGVGAAALGPVLATYTGALISDTAVPAWHDAHRELPFIFAGSAASAAGGLAMIGTPVDESGPARRMALLGAVVEITAAEVLLGRLGLVGRPYREGRPGAFMKVARNLTIAGAATAVVGRRSRLLSAVAGGSLQAASILTRFGIFQAGLASAKDPSYTVVPQRNRVDSRRTR